MSYNPLFDKDVDGNTLNLNLDNFKSHDDMYICQICEGRFNETHYKHNTNLCLDCYQDMKDLIK